MNTRTISRAVSVSTGYIYQATHDHVSFDLYGHPYGPHKTVYGSYMGTKS